MFHTFVYCYSGSHITILCRRSQLNSGVYGTTYGFSQSIQFLGFSLALGFGAYQVMQEPGSIAYARFSDIFTVFMAVIFGAIGSGQATSFAPNYAKAKLSANRIFALLDREPVIDGYSTDGLEPVRFCAWYLTIWVVLSMIS